MVSFASFVVLAVALAAPAAAFPAHISLAGLSRQDLESAMADFGKYSTPPPPPGPLAFGGTKLVNDAAHPFIAPGANDIRGPCPALNTLANHGYISRNGIDTPGNIVGAAMEGFNMANDLAKFTCYAAFIVNGNPITNLLSIGGKSSKTGPDPDAPGPVVGGLNTHNVFEGDSSMTRSDYYDGGDVHTFNETLFQGFVEYSNKYGGGRYNLTAAGEYRYKRIMDGVMNNPTFTIVAPRLFSAYSEAVNPINLWVDGRQDDGQLKLDVARSFFEAARFPDDFHRPARPMTADNEAVVLAAHPVDPGRNVNGVNTYTADVSTGSLPDKCSQYEGHVNSTLRSLYPNPTGNLLDALRADVHYFYTSVQAAGCAEIFPYGRVEDGENNAYRAKIDLPGASLNIPNHNFASATVAGPRTLVNTATNSPTASPSVPDAPAATAPAPSAPAASMPAPACPAPPTGPASMPAVTSASMPAVTESASMPAVTESASMPVVTESASMPAVTESASMPAVTESASMPAATESASMPAVSASMPVVTESASMPAVTESASMPAATESASMPAVSASMPAVSASMPAVSASMPAATEPASMPAVSESASMPAVMESASMSAVTESAPMPAETQSAPMSAMTDSAAMPGATESASLSAVSESASMPAATEPVSMPAATESAPMPAATESAPLSEAASMPAATHSIPLVPVASSAAAPSVSSA